MGKYLWLVGGLALLGTLAFVGWQRSVDRTADTEGRAAPAAVPATKRVRQDDQERRPEPISKPVSPASDSPDESEPGQVEPSWQAAVGLPKQVRSELRNSDDPLFQELLRRNSQLTQQTADDGWGLQMQERLNEFFESRSQEKGEAESVLTTVACRGLQCQVQIVSQVQPAAGGTPLSEVLFEELNRHWWFRDQLAIAQSHVTTVDGRRYHLQYFDRKS
jgi:hypothetical protein